MPWPKYMIKLEPHDFIHGWYITRRGRDMGVNISLKTIDPEGALKYNCNTRCCIRGWIALAFGERTLSSVFWSKEALKFTETLIRCSGEQGPLGARHQLGYLAENIFEGFRGYPGISTRKAASLWNKAAEHHGYDMKRAK
jgi:hypothetical protein